MKSNNSKEKANLTGYPFYPKSDDIYNHSKEETEINPEDISKVKVKNDNTVNNNENDFVRVNSGNDLDVPGAALDDDQENIGSEDEENNYYSLGGDNHNDLEESNGD